MTEAGLRDLAARYAWWRAPDAALADRRRFIARVMELGTWEDAHALLAAWGQDAFRAVLSDPPPGVISAKAWRFWHLRLLGAPPGQRPPAGARHPGGPSAHPAPLAPHRPGMTAPDEFPARRTSPLAFPRAAG